MFMLEIQRSDTLTFGRILPACPCSDLAACKFFIKHAKLSREASPRCDAAVAPHLGRINYVLILIFILIVQKSAKLYFDHSVHHSVVKPRSICRRRSARLRINFSRTSCLYYVLAYEFSSTFARHTGRKSKFCIPELQNLDFSLKCNKFHSNRSSSIILKKKKKSASAFYICI